MKYDGDFWSTSERRWLFTINRQLTLREWRRVLNMTQAEMANELGIHVNTWKKYEKHPTTIQLGMLVKICDAMGISIGEVKLFTDRGDPWSEGRMR